MNTIRNILIIIILVILGKINYSYSQVIYQYNDDANGAPGFVDPNLQIDSLHFDWLNYNCTNAYSAYNFRDLYYDDQMDFSFSLNKSISLTLNPQPGYQVNVSSIQMDIGKSSSGPNLYFLAYSYDNGASWLTGPDNSMIGMNCTSWVTYVWDITDYTFNNQVLIRIYGAMATSSGGSFYIRNLQVNGNVLSSTILPQVNATGGDIYACDGQNFLLTSTCSDLTAVPQWEVGTTEENSFTPIPGGNVNNLFVPVIQYNTNGIRLRIKYTHANGVTYGSLIRFITESSPLPGVNAGNDTTVYVTCGNTSIQLLALPNANSTNTYWSSSGDGTFDDAGSSVPVYTAGPSDIINGEAMLMCKTNSIYMCSDATDTVIVYFQPTQILQSPDTVVSCYGASVILNAVTGFSSYLWSTGSTSPFVTTSSPGVYTVTVTLPGGCTAADSITVISGTNVPAGIVANGPVIFCSGDSVELTAPAGYSYVWKKYGNIIPNEINNTITVKSKGIYKAIITSAQGCSRATNKIPTDVYPVPSKILNASGSLQICAGDSVILLAETGTGYSYSWKKYGNLISGATNASLVAKNNGKYKAIITNSYGCSKISEIAEVVVTFCPEYVDPMKQVQNLEFKVYPNPVNYQASLEFISDIQGYSTITIIDMTGKQVYNGNYEIKEGINKIEQDVTSFGKGVYVIMVQQNGDRRLGKYMVQ